MFNPSEKQTIHPYHQVNKPFPLWTLPLLAFLPSATLFIRSLLQ